MIQPQKELSVTKAAVLCGVIRNTVSYWIKTKEAECPYEGYELIR